MPPYNKTAPTSNGKQPASKRTTTNAQNNSILAREFVWSNEDEPHAIRRRLILAKYPQIKDLMHPEPRTFPICLGIFALQMGAAYYCQNAPWYVFLFLAYAFGGTLNHTLQLAVHELSHNLCFHSGMANKLFAIFCNFPTALPSAIMFQKYHMDHHAYQGVDGVDTDIPSLPEVRFFDNRIKKAVWLFCQPLFYAVRPLLIKPKKAGFWEFVNALSVFAFDVVVYHTLGGWALAYLVTGTLLGMGLHPAAGHFVAEHYTLTPGQETYSYYGPLNRVNFNVGYHNEHHDFPKVPWSNLPLVRKIAPEFYDIPHYTSYLHVFYRYIVDPNIGPFSRVKRLKTKGEM